MILWWRANALSGDISLSNSISQNSQPFWSVSASELVQRLQTTSEGLTSDEALKRLIRYVRPKKRSEALAVLAQFKSPIIVILIFAAGASFFLGDPGNALIILVIILVSSLLGFWQERSATNAVEKLLAIVQVKAMVLRDGNQKEIPVEQIVPGDIVILNAGDLIPGDCLVLESRDLFVNEASLTGETYPVEKTAEILASEKSLCLGRKDSKKKPLIIEHDERRLQNAAETLLLSEESDEEEERQREETQEEDQREEEDEEELEREGADESGEEKDEDRRELGTEEYEREGTGRTRRRLVKVKKPKRKSS